MERIFLLKSKVNRGSFMRDVFSARWSLIALVNSATVASIDSERASKRNEVIFAFVSYK